MTNPNDMTLFVTTSRGLEPALRMEIVDTLSAVGVQITPDEIALGAGGVTLKASWEQVAHLQVRLSIASRILWVLDKATVKDTEGIYQCASGILWTSLFHVGRSIVVHSSCVNAFLTDSIYLSQKIKDAVADQFRNYCGDRPNVDLREADIAIHARLAGHELILSMDLTGEPLSHRGYRQGSGTAALRENVAAGLLRYSGWIDLVKSLEDPEHVCYFERATEESDSNPSRIPKSVLLSPVFWDPMCGSGTIVIEAAIAIQRRFPNAARSNFLMMNLKNPPKEFLLDAQTLAKSLLRTDDQVRDLVNRYLKTAGIVTTEPWALQGSDIDQAQVELAKTNATQAGVDGLIRFKKQDFLQAPKPASVGILLSNAPYGSRAVLVSDTFYKSIGDKFKQDLAGWTCWLMRDVEHKAVGLRATRNHNLQNASIACMFSQFVMFPKVI